MVFAKLSFDVTRRFIAQDITLSIIETWAESRFYESVKELEQFPIVVGWTRNKLGEINNKPFPVNMFNTFTLFPTGQWDREVLTQVSSHNVPTPVTNASVFYKHKMPHRRYAASKGNAVEISCGPNPHPLTRKWSSRLTSSPIEAVHRPWLSRSGMLAHLLLGSGNNLQIRTLYVHSSQRRCRTKIRRNLFYCVTSEQSLLALRRRRRRDGSWRLTRKSVGCRSRSPTVSCISCIWFGSLLWGPPWPASVSFRRLHAVHV